MQGKITKGIAGFYYVYVQNIGLIECKAKGIFRNRKVKPLVGDMVEIDLLDEEEKLGNITEILPRKNELIRPAVSNIDQAFIVFAIKKPKPNYNLLDRFLMMMEKYQVPTIVCFNKKDLAKEKDLEILEQTYQNSGHKIIFSSAEQGVGIEDIKSRLEGKTTVFAGPSGVGKSTIMNMLDSEIQMETGEISEKIQRGKHTTRHSQLLHLHGETFVLDTPGFSSLFVDMFEEEEIREYFREFEPYEGTCRFQGCSHTHEPNCGVKEAVEEGKISRIRYENYVEIYKELKEKRKW